MTKKLKIAFITAQFPPQVCGIGDYTYQLIEAMKQQQKSDDDITIQVFCLAEKNRKTNEGIFECTSWSFQNIWRIIKVLQKEKFDIVHLQNTSIKSIHYYLLPFWIKLFTQIKVITTIHEHTEKTFVGKCANYVNVLFSNRVIVTEKSYIDSLKFLKKKEQFYTIDVPSNIPQSKISEEQKKDIRLRYTRHKDQLLVVYFGFVVPSKGVEHIFEFCNPEKHFILLISNLNSYESSYTQKVKDFLNTPTWKANSFCTGYLPDYQVADLLASADICLFPFLKGASARNASLKAALLQGTYCITTHEQESGYHSESNIYFVPTSKLNLIDDALKFYEQLEIKTINSKQNSWYTVAIEHIKIYNNL
jgi:glycosyltransferase involved in cell wall biosynthesis